MKSNLTSRNHKKIYSVCVHPWSLGNHLEPNGTTAFPDTITDLHCFDENIHDMDYYRPCEKAVREIDVSVFFLNLQLNFLTLLGIKPIIYVQKNQTLIAISYPS